MRVCPYSRVLSWLHRQREVVRLSNDLSSEDIEILLDAGLKHEVPMAVAHYKKAIKDANQAAHDTKQCELEDAMTRIDSEGAVLLHCIEESLMSEVLAKFPSVIYYVSKTSGMTSATQYPCPRIMADCQ